MCLLRDLQNRNLRLCGFDSGLASRSGLIHLAQWQSSADGLIPSSFTAELRRRGNTATLTATNMHGRYIVRGRDSPTGAERSVKRNDFSVCVRRRNCEQNGEAPRADAPARLCTLRLFALMSALFSRVDRSRSLISHFFFFSFALTYRLH